MGRWPRCDICNQEAAVSFLHTTWRLQRFKEKIYTDWANHYLAKSGCPRLIKDLSQDVTDGVLLAQIIQIIDIMTTFQVCPPDRADCLLSSSQIENVDTCLSFLDARGVNVQGLSAEEIRNGNLKSILGLFFILSRYKQQQQQQQQYYQSLVELSQQTSSSAPSTSSPKTHDMQSSEWFEFSIQLQATSHSFFNTLLSSQTAWSSSLQPPWPGVSEKIGRGDKERAAECGAQRRPRSSRVCCGRKLLTHAPR
uniref:Neuron navigator 3 n=1 Tax=Oryzias latipes TaxID=8090 RepID=A0A3P9IGQ6_ORYLA